MQIHKIKLIVSVFFALILWLPSVAQKKLAVGIRAGFGFSSIQPLGKYSNRLSYKNTMQLGLYGEVRFSKAIFMQAELLYTNPGIRLFQVNKQGYKTADSALVMNTIILPVQLKCKLGNERIKGYYMVGIAPTFFLDANIRYKIDSTKTNFNYIDFVRRSGLSLMNTIGVEVDIDELVIPFIDFRYVQGLHTIFKDPITEAIIPDNYIVQFLLNVGVKF